MDNTRELERLLRRAKRVGRELKPPTVSVVVWNQGEEEPPHTDFQVRIMIEQQRELQ